MGPWLQGQESVYQSDILEIVTSSSTSVSLSKKHWSVSPHYCSSAVLSGSELSRGLSISIQTATVDGQQGDYLGILSTFRSSRRSYTAGHAAEAHIEFCDWRQLKVSLCLFVQVCPWSLPSGALWVFRSLCAGSLPESHCVWATAVWSCVDLCPAYGLQVHVVNGLGPLVTW